MNEDSLRWFRRGQQSSRSGLLRGSNMVTKGVTGKRWAKINMVETVNNNMVIVNLEMVMRWP